MMTNIYVKSRIKIFVIFIKYISYTDIFIKFKYRLKTYLNLTCKNIFTFEYLILLIKKIILHFYSMKCFKNSIISENK